MTIALTDTPDDGGSGAVAVPKRVLFVSPMDLTGHSGGNVATKEMVAAFGRQPGVDLSLVCPRPEETLPSEIAETVSGTWYLPRKPAGTLAWHAKSQPAMARALWSVYREVDPDLVVARVGPSTVVTPLSALLTRTPYVALVRGMVGRNLTFGSVADQIVRANALAADTVYAAYGEIIERYGLKDLTDATVFPNAVDTTKFRPIPKAEARSAVAAPLSDDDFVVGFVGSLKERHRVGTLLRATSQMAPDVSIRVLVVGDGPLREDLERQAAALGLADRVTFTGFVPHEELSPYVSSCDVTYGVVDESNPSNPIKCYEYLACERPVVTSATDELAFVEAEDLGVGLETVDPNSVAVALRQLHALGPEARAEMGRRGREYVVENHTWDRLAATVCGVDGRPRAARD